MLTESVNVVGGAGGAGGGTCVFQDVNANDVEKAVVEALALLKSRVPDADVVICAMNTKHYHVLYAGRRIVHLGLLARASQSINEELDVRSAVKPIGGDLSNHHLSK